MLHSCSKGLLQLSEGNSIPQNWHPENLVRVDTETSIFDEAVSNH